MRTWVIILFVLLLIALVVGANRWGQESDQALALPEPGAPGAQPAEPEAPVLPPAEPVAPDTTGMLPADPDAPLTYVALGDSTVYGAGASRPELNYVNLLHNQIQDIYPQAAAVNLGVNGATAADVVQGQLAQALEQNPQLVTLSVGPNDVTRGREVDAYQRDIETIFRTLTDSTEAVIVVNLLPDLAIAPGLSPEQREAVAPQVVRFNTALEETAQRYNVELVDLYTASQQEAAGNPQLLASDQYHPSDEGYARWAALMWEGVQNRIP